jgi:voltage-dependent potassium channel beta subunit
MRARSATKEAKMKYRSLGQCGLKVSEISIGGWVTIGGTVDEAMGIRILHTAVDGGINFIDLADVYARGESERVSGKFLHEYTAGAGRDRSDLVISSKVFWPMGDGPNDRGLSRKHIIESCEKSLKRLGTDYLDVYFCHRFDAETPLEETVRAMDDLIRQGKVLYWGTSVWGGEQMRAAHELGYRRNADRPVVEQPCYNLLQRGIEDDVMPTAASLGMGLVVWSPLAQGMLTGKYNDGVPAGSRAAKTAWLQSLLNDANIEKTRRFVSLATEHGTSPEALALRWILRRPEVSSVITGASNPEQVKHNLAAVDYELPEALAARLDQLFAR